MVPNRVLAEKGTETVKLNKSQKKESYKVYRCISVAGEKLPCWILAKSKTSRSETKFGSHPDLILKHTESGWSTNQMVVKYVTWLLQRCGGDHFVLVLDLYSSHRTPHLRAQAQQLRVELPFVPVGATSILQPLDRRIFGELKARARAEFSHEAGQHDGFGLGPLDTIAILIRASEATSPENGQKAWLPSEISPDVTSEDISE
jgi:hypothetical protein